jgi:hypothetical protein
MVAVQRTKIFFRKNEGKLLVNSPMESPKCGCPKFLAYHVLPCEWLNMGWICLMEMLSPKLYTGLVGLPNELMVPPSKVYDLLGHNTHKESHCRQTESIPHIRTKHNKPYFHQDLQ